MKIGVLFRRQPHNISEVHSICLLLPSSCPWLHSVYEWNTPSALRGLVFASGGGMKSASSPGAVSERPLRHSSFACSIRSFRDETKFHPNQRRPSLGSSLNSLTPAAFRARTTI